MNPNTSILDHKFLGGYNNFLELNFNWHGDYKKINTYFINTIATERLSSFSEDITCASTTWLSVNKMKCPHCWKSSPPHCRCSTKDNYHPSCCRNMLLTAVASESTPQTQDWNAFIPVLEALGVERTYQFGKQIPWIQEKPRTNLSICLWYNCQSALWAIFSISTTRLGEDRKGWKGASILTDQVILCTPSLCWR